MRANTPIGRAAASYCAAWPTSPIDVDGVGRVNPETLGNATSPDFSFRYVDITSVTRGVIDWRSVAHLRFADAPSRARRLLRKGDTLLCTVRPLLMSHAFLEPTDGVPAVCSTGFAVLRGDHGLRPDFLKHLPFSEQITRQLVAWQCGTNYPAVNERDVRSLLVPVPPTDEQAAIARILDAVDTALERTRQAIAAAEALVVSLIDDAVAGEIATTGMRALKGAAQVHERLGRLPVGWTVMRLGTACTRIVDGTHQAVETAREGLPFLYVSCVRGRRIDWNKASFVSERTYQRIAKGREPKRGSVLYTAVGSYGHAALVSTDKPFSFQRHIAVLYPKEDRLLGGYLALWMNSQRGKRWSDVHAVGNAQKTVTLTELSKMLVACPPTSVQGELVETVQGADAVVDVLATRLATLSDLKRALSHDLLTGRVRVRDAVKVTAS